MAAAAGSVLGIAYGAQFSYGVFVRAMEDDLGWSRGQLAAPQAAYIFVYSALSFLSGIATDRYGPRVVIALGAVLLGSAYAMMSLVTSLWQVYLILVVVGAIGMSASFVPCNATVVKWFVRKRGRALGVSASGNSLGNIVVPLIAASLISTFGWRQSWLLLGIGAAVIMSAAASAMARDPESVGLLPDGDAHDPRVVPRAVGAAATATVEAAYTAREAMRTQAFWIIYGVYLLTWMAVFIPLVHAPAFTEDLGYSTLTGASVVSAIGLGGLFGRLTVGPASDRVGRRPALATMLVFEASAFVLLALGSTLSLLYPAAFLFGFAYGGGVVVFPALAGDFFGRASAGAIVGMIFAAAGAPAATGPFVAGFLFDATGSYRVAFVLGAIVNLASLGLLTQLRPPARSPVPAVAT